MASTLARTSVLARRVQLVHTQQRSMANLKELKIRMASVDSIKKITASMKLVAAARMKAAEDRMHRVRPFATSTEIFSDAVADKSEENKKHLLVLLTSDRGLCGSINSSLVRASREILRRKPGTEIIVLGEKGKAGLLREYGSQFVLTATELGKRQLNFTDVVPIAEFITKHEFDTATMVSNKFISVLAFETLINPFHPAPFWKERADLSEFEFENERPDVMQSYFEYAAAAQIYSALTENTAAELSARMTSMDNATKNAGEMLQTLTLSYNRRRQAGITTELSEIIAGTEAIQEVE